MSKGDIFIIDDNPINLNLLAGILREKDYQVRVATSGKRGIVAVRMSLPELIMLDITMPEMDGYEVCRELKADAATCDIPVIFISALDEVLDKVKAFEVGGVDYVTKPFQVEEVLARIGNQLRISRLQKALSDTNTQLKASQQETERKNEQLSSAKEELERKNLELDQTIKELAQKNEELIASQKQADRIFSVLAEALPGSLLDGKYRLDEKIGTGGFGAVFRATQLALNRPVAVKVFRPTPGNDSAEAVERFRREGISACRVQHPNAVTVLDSGLSAEGIAYLVMELLEGHTLKDELNGHKPLSLKRCLDILLPVCQVLEEAHAAGLVHRDIKPDNIFLHQTKDGEVVKVVDFGIAKLVGDTFGKGLGTLTEVGSFIGTPAYMAPERIGHKPYDGRADVYSLGVMLYEMLSGRLPFAEGDDSNVVEVMLMHLTKEPSPLRAFAPKLPLPVEAVVTKAMLKDPSGRPAAKEFAAEFAQAVADAPDEIPGEEISQAASSSEITLQRAANVSSDQQEISQCETVAPTSLADELHS